MGFFDRIEDIIKSYLHDDDDHIFGRSAGKEWSSSPDPDLKAAFEELNDFLSGGSGKEKTGFGAGGNTGYGRAEGFGPAQTSGVSEALRQDFAELGLTPGASAGECKAAYKQLLKKHHPDRHAGHPGNLKKATEKSARLNAAYDRIERWRQTGRVE
ncbi:MAG: J domain-containing protein [Spirochaetaceae bacterium]|jgi:DnaJ-domain-containing protein 1|nr:J domain-containing protein [Spirochaetaceae bacterium]